MDIIVTGARGFIGEHLIKELSIDHNVVAISRRPVLQFQSSKVIQVKCDVTDQESTIFLIQKAIEKHKLSPAVIIHLASKMADSTNLNNLEVLEENQKISWTISKVAKAFKVKQIINFSSSAVYPNVDGVFSENSKTDPSQNSDCIYGLSKLNSEFLLDYTLREEEIVIQHLRLSIVDGAGAREDRLLPTLRRDITESNEVFLYGLGERIINIVSIDYLIKTVLFFLGNSTSGVYNVNENSLTTLQIVNDFAERNGIVDLNIVLVDEGNKSKFRIDSSKVRQLMKHV